MNLITVFLLLICAFGICLGFQRLCYDLQNSCGTDASQCEREPFARVCVKTCSQKCMRGAQLNQWINRKPEYPLLDVGDPFLKRSSAALGCNDLMHAMNESHFQKLVHVATNFATGLYHQLNKQVGNYVKLDQVFKDSVLKCFAVDATKLSRQRFDHLNSIVEKYSRGYMKNVFDSAPETEKHGVWLMNFLYLIAAWEQKFTPGAYKTFTFPDGSSREIPMMVSTAKYPFYENEQFSLVGIPTVEHAHTVYFATPKAGRTLPDVETVVMRPAFLNSLHAALGKKELKIFMPQFQIPKSKFDLLGPLKGLGMDFSKNTDFGTNIQSTVSNAKPQLTHFIQMAQVMVNNQGIAAQAQSVAGFELISRKQLLIMDRPYLFFVLDNFSGTVLFMGRVVNPEM